MNGIKLYSFSRAPSPTFVQTNNNNVFIITENPYYFVGGNSSQLFNQILSTFKFIDPTVGWQVYKNEQYEFEVRYPKEWGIKNSANGAEFMPTNYQKPEKIIISINASSNRFLQQDLKTIAEWLAQRPGVKCDLEEITNGQQWCKVKIERFEGVRADSYGTTINNVDYISSFNVFGGRQSMDSYLSGEELKEEIKILDQILFTFKFTK